MHGTNMKGFRNRLLDHMSLERPALRNLVEWAETQEGSLPTTLPASTDAIMTTLTDVDRSRTALFSVICSKLGDKMGVWRKKANGDGLELWRALYWEYKGASKEVMAIKRDQFQNPTRVKSVEALGGGVLDAWEILGRECGDDLPEDWKITALDRLIPESAITQMETQGVDGFGKRMAFLRRQISRVRNNTCAQHAAGRKGPVPMDVSTVNKKEEEDGDKSWPEAEDQMAELWQCMSFLKGKGKGKATAWKGGGKGGGAKGAWTPGGKKGGGKKGGGRDGGGKKGEGKGGKGGEQFDGCCFYCGTYGHRLNQCKKKDRDVANGVNAVGGEGGDTAEDGGEEQWEEDHEEGDEATGEYAWPLYNVTPTPTPEETSRGETRCLGNNICPLSTPDAETSMRCEVCRRYAKVPFRSCQYCGATPSFNHGGCCPQKPIAECPRKPRARTLGDWMVQGPGKKSWARKEGISALSPVATVALQCSTGAGKVRFASTTDIKEVKEIEDATVSPILKTASKPVAQVQKGKEWDGLQKIEALVDSGAFDHVIGKSCVANYPIRPGKAKGSKYTVGSGHEIENQGEQPMIMKSQEGVKRRFVWQVTDVNRPILSVSRLTEDGDDVRFWKNRKGGRIICGQTGQEMRFRSKHGVYVLDLWVMNNPDGNAPPGIKQGVLKRGPSKAEGFTRQGR